MTVRRTATRVTSAIVCQPDKETVRATIVLVSGRATRRDCPDA